MLTYNEDRDACLLSNLSFIIAVLRVYGRDTIADKHTYRLHSRPALGLIVE